MTAHALLQTLQDPSKQGLYHTIAAGETTWHGYASFVVEQAKQMGYTIKTQEIMAVPTSAFSTPAKRPNNSRLSTQRFQNTFSMICPAWQQGVQRMIEEITE
jgi:dTDP-4-dehydrorhamnose reductase